MDTTVKHPRRLIREAVAAALVDKTRAGPRVFSNRPNALSQAPSALPGDTREFPAIIVYTRSTRSEVFDESPRRYRHEAELFVECADEILPGDEIDDQLDQFEQEVSDALLLDDTLGGTADDLRFTGSTMAVRADGAQLLGACVLSFNAIYFTYAPAEGAQALDSLRHVHVEYSLDGGQDDPRDRAKTDIADLG